LNLHIGLIVAFGRIKHLIDYYTHVFIAISKILDELTANQRPLKILNYKTPYAIFFEKNKAG